MHPKSFVSNFWGALQFGIRFGNCYRRGNQYTCSAEFRNVRVESHAIISAMCREIIITLYNLPSVAIEGGGTTGIRPADRLNTILKILEKVHISLCA